MCANCLGVTRAKLFSVSELGSDDFLGLVEGAVAGSDVDAGRVELSSSAGFISMSPEAFVLGLSCKQQEGCDSEYKLRHKSKCTEKTHRLHHIASSGGFFFLLGPLSGLGFRRRGQDGGCNLLCRLFYGRLDTGRIGEQARLGIGDKGKRGSLAK